MRKQGRPQMQPNVFEGVLEGSPGENADDSVAPSQWRSQNIDNNRTME